jgi:hypothetical protein
MGNPTLVEKIILFGGKMKKITIVALLCLASAVSWAAEDSPLFNCNFKLDDHTRLFDNLELKVEVSCVNGITNDPKCIGYLATVNVSCDICIPAPKTFGLTSLTRPLEDNFEGVFNGVKLALDIPLESFVSTKTHQSTLSYEGINHGQPISGTCTEAK